VRIEIVQLENIRSHSKSTVPFATGFNCLVGGLGCGKSSILYSIDFALFGDPVGRTFEYLLRDDAQDARVVVQFSQNGKTYKITRGLKRKGKSISQDVDELKLFEGDTLLSSLRNDAVAEQLKVITGLDKDLFREIVWVRQEHLKELLDDTPRERQRRLDELFGLSDFEAAWSNLAAYQKEYEGERKAFEKDPDITGMENFATEYNQRVEEFSLLEIQLQDTIGKASAAKKALDDADNRLRQVEQIKTKNDELKRQETRLITSLEHLKEALSSGEEKTSRKRFAIENLTQRQNTLTAQIESCEAVLRSIGLATDQPFETLKLQVSNVDDRISSLRAEQETLSRNIQTDRRRLSQLATENRCPTCLQTLSDEYRNGMVRRIETENAGRQATIVNIQRQLDDLQQIRAKANSSFSNLQILTPRSLDLDAQIREETDDLRRLTEECSKQKSLASEACSRLDAVRAEISRFDTSELECAREMRDTAFERYSALKSNLSLLESRKKDLTRRLNEVKERINQAQVKIERMQRLVKISDLITCIRDAYRSIQPKMRGEFVKVLRNFVQQVLDSLTGSEGQLLNVQVDEAYTPFVKSESGVERDITYLSGGERTLLAFAYRLGLGQLIMQSRTGRGLSILLLDEPTESLGREDGSIDRLAEAISRFRAVEQIIAVTHSEAFAEKAEHVIRLEKEAGVSKASMER
jgi:exonuclease SbcC